MQEGNWKRRKAGNEAGRRSRDKAELGQWKRAGVGGLMRGGRGGNRESSVKSRKG